MAETKDKIVEQLFALLQTKKDEIAKVERPNWLTNCSFPRSLSGSDRLNIQTVGDANDLTDALAALLTRKVGHAEAKKLLGTSGEFKWGGFTVEEWTADFQTRVAKINVGNKKKELTDIEARLDKLVSKEKREEMELAALTAMLSK